MWQGEDDIIMIPKRTQGPLLTEMTNKLCYCISNISRIIICQRKGCRDIVAAEGIIDLWKTKESEEGEEGRQEMFRYCYRHQKGITENVYVLIRNHVFEV